MRKSHKLALIPLLLVAACGDDPGTGPAPITAIDVVAPSNVVVVGRSMAVEVEARAAGGGSVPAPTVSWSTSDAAVADVSAAGVVTGVGEGEAVITATVEEHEASLAVRVAPDSLPVFTAAPFEDLYDVWNAFDHDLPIWSGESGQILTWQGSNVPGLEGHDGYDWPMPRGTPLFAVGDGVVSFAGSETPWSCPILNGETVSAKVVAVLHTAAGGERFQSIYIHLDRIDVEYGDSVVAGQQIGLSGNTGCSSGPHLHFEVGRELYQRTPNPGRVVVTDPSGWAGSQHDPWLLHDRGAASSHLWADGAAPRLSRASILAAPSMIAAPDSPAHMHRFTAPPLPPRSTPDCQLAPVPHPSPCGFSTRYAPSISSPSMVSMAQE